MYRVMLLNSKVFPNSKVLNSECDRYYYDKQYCTVCTVCTVYAFKFTLVRQTESRPHIFSFLSYRNYAEKKN